MSRRAVFFAVGLAAMFSLSACASINPFAALPQYEGAAVSYSDLYAKDPAQLGEESKTYSICENPEMSGYFLAVPVKTQMRNNPSSDEAVFVHNGNGTVLVYDGGKVAGKYPMDEGSIFIIGMGTNWRFVADERRHFDPVVLYCALVPPPVKSSSKPAAKPEPAPGKQSEPPKRISGNAAPPRSETLQNLNDMDPVAEGERVHESPISAFSTASVFVTRLTDEIRLRSDPTFDELVFVHLGDGFMTIGKNTYPAKPGSAFFIPRNAEWKFIPIEPATVKPVVFYQVFSPVYVKEESSGPAE
jgi:mannose-6-phosphate isomerase-like protein (cupin superfamily)